MCFFIDENDYFIYRACVSLVSHVSSDFQFISAMLLLNVFRVRLLPSLALLVCSSAVSAQTPVTEVFTDFGGYWTSSSTSLNATLPDDHHHLLAFTLGGVTYSTGVDDTKLDNNGVTYTAAEFEALQISGLPFTGPASYLIFQGAAVDGDAAGSGAFTAPSDSSDVAAYLMDGTNGLDFGTGVANIVSNVYQFDVSNLQSDAIADGEPDMIFTQMAEISTTKDSICFLDEDDNLIGQKVGINWSGVPALGNWSADFYAFDGTNASAAISKPIRVAGLDFTDLTLTAANIDGVAAIRIDWGGASDPAFVSLNSGSFGIPCDQLTYSSLSLVSAASSPVAEDGAVTASISNGNEPYRLVSVLTGDTLDAADWNAIPSGRYLFKALDDADCLSTNSFSVSIPNRSCN